MVPQRFSKPPQVVKPTRARERVGVGVCACLYGSALPAAMAESGDLLKAIETVDEWVNICGDDATKDMLFIVETYASWCGPSQAALSTYRKIKEQNEQKKFKLCKVCADLSDDFNGRSTFELSKYKINPRPTFILFKDGEVVAVVEGVSMPTLEK